ncbi:MAG: LPS export ABC transporter periplasmic protein LptC [Candidatus Aminicenantes bacterium]|nr:LPS export ABC transporter periplasmic protein LptC [Candidatus Aminicenantes bacterium]
MRPDKRFAQLRLARGAAIAALLLTIAALIISFIVRRSPRPAPDVPALLEEAKVSRTEGVQHVEFKSGRGVFRINTKRLFAGEDGLNHLEGGVDVVYYGRTGSLEVTFSADRATYDRELRNFVLEGNAQVRHKDLILESSAFTYDNDRNLFRTDRGVTATSGRLSGSARAAVYRESGEELELSGEVRLEFRPGREDEAPLELETDRIVYRRPGKTGEVEGNLLLRQKASWARGESGTFILSADEQRLKSVTLRGNANASLVPEGPGGRPRTIRCDELVLGFYADSNALEFAEGTKDCVLDFEDESGRPASIVAGRTILYFAPAGGLKDFEAAGDARVVLESGAAGGRREGRAERALFHQAGKTLRLIGRKGVPAVFDVGDTSIEAADIRASLETGNIQAAGAVRVVLKPSPQGAAVGFFSRQNPIVTVCEDMRYIKARKRFYFKTGVRIWQEKESLSAAEVEIVEDTTEVFARGGVQSLFSRRPKDSAAEERIAVGAEAMNYFPGDRRVAYEGRGTMNLKDLSLEAGTVSVFLKRDGGDIESVLAKGRVVVKRGDREARGEEARYVLAEETVVLTGQPVLIDKEKGTVEGDKLIFHLGDGRIQVENTDRERSVIIIRS